MYIYYHQLSHCIFRSLTYTTFKQTIPINIIAYLSLHRRCRQNASIQPLPLPLLSLHCCRQHHPPAADTTHHFWLQKHVRPSVFGPAAVIVRVLFASADVLNSFCGYSTVPLQQFRLHKKRVRGWSLESSSTMSPSPQPPLMLMPVATQCLPWLG